ncbi:MAG: ketoacyl-ACP synthase III [Oscillospiraceae bacterium]|nr:ketoacyl-ACP synthase III [Oscillospiraceae bacterium]
MTSLKIIGTGRNLPARRVTNDDLATFLDTSDEWIVTRTGIRSRRVCTSETLTDLSVTAAEQALDKAGLKAQNIDLLLCSTIGGDFRTPSLACCVAERLGTGCPAFDLNAACAGFVYALDVANLYLTKPEIKNILIVSAEKMSTQIDWNDRSTCVLFGDGAAACVVTRGNALRYLHLHTKADVAPLYMPSGPGNSPFIEDKTPGGFLHMAGQDVFKFAVGVIEGEIKRALDTVRLPPEQVDYFLLHQANKRIIDFAIARVKQPPEKFPLNIDRTGNISSASIPLLLDEMLEEGKIKPGDTLFMAAFGAGLTAGSCVMIWE